MAFSSLDNSEACVKVRNYSEIPLDESPLMRFTGLGLVIFSVPFVLFCLIYFACHKNNPKLVLLHNRGFQMIFWVSVGALCYTFLIPFKNFWGVREFPCDAYAVLSAGTVIFVWTPFYIRLQTLYHRIKYNEDMIELTFESLKPVIGDIPDVLTLSGKGSAAGSLILSLKDKKETTVKSVTDIASTMLRLKNKKSCKRKFMKALLFVPKILILVSVNVFGLGTKFMSPVVYKITCWKTPMHVPDQLQHRYFQASTTYANFSLFVATIVVATTWFTYYYIFFEPFGGCYGCEIDKLLDLQLAIIFAQMVMLVLILGALWPYPDNLGIKHELTFLTILGIFVYVVLVPGLDEATGGRFFIDGKWSWSYVTLLGLLFGEFYMLPYQVFRAKRAARKHKITQSKNKGLQNILSTERGTKAFALHLATELALENLYFYKAAEAWKREYSNLSPNDANEAARNLFELYFSSEAAYPLNLSFALIQKTKEDIEGAADCDETVFDEAMAEVFIMMSSDSYHRFLRGKYYKALESKLVTSMEDLI